LYYNAIREVSSYAKSYGQTKGLDIKVFIATHSLVNYSSWQIVSPEASLSSLPGIDGYIAQVWTGTSREPVYFNGQKKERVFQNAFLEYGSMVSMTAPTGRKMYFLTDPIEDWARDWSDYKKNYEATFTAELLYPGVDRYEVMPWPERIYTHRYKLANSDTSVLIPRSYSTQIQIMINCLNQMPASQHAISGSPGIGVLMSNSLMFQRFPTHNGYNDPQFSNFYGQTIPLLQLGIPVQTVHMENLSYPASLKEVKVLIMSYSNMKPMEPAAHQFIAAWVKKGGVLIYCGKDDDPYQSVPEWWNTKGNHYGSPSDQLFALLGVSPPAKDSSFVFGKGAVHIIREDPKNFVMRAGGDSLYKTIVQTAYEKEAGAGKLVLKNNFYLERGPYRLIAVMEEGVDAEPYRAKGSFIDLFDPKLPVLTEKIVAPGQQALLYDLGWIKNRQEPLVVAAAARIEGESRAGRHYSFVAKSPLHTTNIMRVFLPAPPVKVGLTDDKGQAVAMQEGSWDPASHTYLLRFENAPEGVRVECVW
jgi:hypothetical protein